MRLYGTRSWEEGASDVGTGSLKPTERTTWAPVSTRVLLLDFEPSVTGRALESPTGVLKDEATAADGAVEVHVILYTGFDPAVQPTAFEGVADQALPHTRIVGMRNAYEFKDWTVTPAICRSTYDTGTEVCTVTKVARGKDADGYHVESFRGTKFYVSYWEHDHCWRYQDLRGQTPSMSLHCPSKTLRGLLNALQADEGEDRDENFEGWRNQYNA